MRWHILAILTLTVVFFSAQQSRATLTTFDYPGSPTTYLYGISGSTIVGNSDTTNGSGFIWDGSNFSHITVTQTIPGGGTVSSPTAIFGVDGSTYAGTYDIIEPLRTGAWFKTGATATTFGVTGNPFGSDSYQTYARGISQGSVVGYSTDAGGGGVAAFIKTGSTTQWFRVQLPDPSLPVIDNFQTWGYGISGTKIVGKYAGSSSSTTSHGYVYDGTTLTTLDYPGSSSTQALGIDGNNIVGNYTLGGVTHGFFYNGANWATIDYPGADTTFVTDIDGGNIVGYYTLGGATHGFIGTVPEPASVVLAICCFGAVGLVVAKRKKG